MLPDFAVEIAYAQEAFDDLITMGTLCNLISIGVQSPCVNCVYDPIGKKSANRWLTGGPLSFPDGTICPQCGGSGVRVMEYTDSIRMTIAWELTGERNKYNKMSNNIRVADGTIRSRGFLTDLPKIQKCSYMIVADEKSGYLNWKYELASEPIDDFVFVRNRYFTAFWKRVG